MPLALQGGGWEMSLFWVRLAHGLLYDLERELVEVARALRLWARRQHPRTVAGTLPPVKANEKSQTETLPGGSTPGAHSRPASGGTGTGARAPKARQSPGLASATSPSARSRFSSHVRRTCRSMTM